MAAIGEVIVGSTDANRNATRDPFSLIKQRYEEKTERLLGRGMNDLEQIKLQLEVIERRLERLAELVVAITKQLGLALPEEYDR